MAPSAPAFAIAALVALAALAAAPGVVACRGRQIKAFSATPCGKDNILTVVNVTARLQEKGSNCELDMRGCVHIDKPIRSTLLSFLLKKGPLQVYRGDDMDACAMGKQLPIADLIAGPQGDCRHEKGYVCTPSDSEPFDISEYAGMLDMARGKWTATAKLKHDSGKSCVKFNVQIV
ncbi:hypothetical protein R5R35_012726 [Gryllus longicercus]|uniref:Accessory gland protein n=1 Tax=Gryllus longicercus TaxID=2509291 RepID=A0AAN9WBG2_9ORTH